MQDNALDLRILTIYFGRTIGSPLQKSFEFVGVDLCVYPYNLTEYPAR